MHRVLQIPELLLEIVECLEPPDQYHFSLACKPIWCTVIPVLWRTTHECALYHFLPEDFEVLESGTDAASLSRTLLPSDCDRLNIYSPFVHHLNLRDDRSLRTDAILLFLAHCYSENRTLFPRLRVMTLPVSSGGWRHAAYLRFMSRPCEQLDLFMNHCTCCPHISLNRFENMLKAIEIMNPAVECLTFWMLESDIDGKAYEDIVASSLSQLLNIKRMSLRLHSDGSSIFPLLAVLPSFVQLSITLTSSAPDFEPYHLQPSAFSSLQALSLETHECVAQFPLVDLLHAISSSELHSFSGLCEDVVVLQEVVCVIVKKWGPILRQLNIRLGKAEGEEPIEMPAEVIRMLVFCYNMKEFMIACYSPLILVDEQMCQLSQAWPWLEGFSIIECWTVHWDDMDRLWEPSTTASALQTLALTCPRLSFLELSINFDRPGKGIGYVAPLNHPLNHLRLSSSTVCTDLFTASCLIRHGLFPRLKALEWAQLDSPDEDDVGEDQEEEGG